jgi:hypothetical protein
MPSLEESITYAQAVLEEFFPTRAKAMIRVLRQRNERFTTIEPWREDQVAGFIELVNFAGMDLKRGFNEQHLSLLGWATRNLLELSIWIAYCDASDENAKRFLEYADVDIKSWEGSSQKQAAIPDSAKVNGLASAAGTNGLEMTGDTPRVVEAAEAIGKGDYFKTRLLLYSKFAHPTAWVIKNASSLDAMPLREMMFIDGAELAFACLNSIRTYILRIFPDGIKMWPLE